MVLRNGHTRGRGALHATFNLPKGADALPTEEVASLGGPAVVFRADWTARQSPTVQETRPPRRGTLHMLPGDATDEEINAVVRAIRGEDEPGG